MSIFIIGDLHGYFDAYRGLLQQAGLTDELGHWTGGTHQLWLIGDLFDRGPAGIDCLDLTMSLQAEARLAGGDVNSLLGNHEMMILCAYYFGDALTSAGMPVMDQWRMWGGTQTDLERMNDDHANWLADLPSMARLDDTLLLHADAMFYVEHGRTVEEVNERLADIVACSQLSRWESTLRAFSEHKAFSGLDHTGTQRASQLLRYYGASRLVHGHTPISIARRQPAHSVVAAWEYAGGTCINVDGGIYLGGPGFVHELQADGKRVSASA